MKKVCLELGGKSPVIIFKDAKIDVAVDEAWQAGFANVSQNCVAGTRIYVQSEVFEEFTQKFKAKSLEVKMGHSFEDGFNWGPLCNKPVFDKYKEYLGIAKEEKLENLFGGNL